MKNVILTAICTILILSCEKEKDINDTDLDLNRPEVPINDSLDINSDKEIATDDVPSSGGSIIGSISPLNQNQLLYSNSAGYLFLGINGKIGKDSNPNSDWSGFDADLIQIDRDYQNWDRTGGVRTAAMLINSAKSNDLTNLVRCSFGYFIGLIRNRFKVRYMPIYYPLCPTPKTSITQLYTNM